MVKFIKVKNELECGPADEVFFFCTLPPGIHTFNAPLLLPFSFLCLFSVLFFILHATACHVHTLTDGIWPIACDEVGELTVYISERLRQPFLKQDLLLKLPVCPVCLVSASQTHAHTVASPHREP